MFSINQLLFLQKNLSLYIQIPNIYLLSFQVMLKGQTDAEETIETWRRADDKATRHAHDSAADQCTELSNFGVKLRDEVRAADNAVSSLIENQIQRDQPTGQTPGRVTR